jgi:hypothetical protein
LCIKLVTDIKFIIWYTVIKTLSYSKCLYVFVGFIFIANPHILSIRNPFQYLLLSSFRSARRLVFNSGFRSEVFMLALLFIHAACTVHFFVLYLIILLLLVRRSHSDYVEVLTLHLSWFPFRFLSLRLRDSAFKIVLRQLRPVSFSLGSETIFHNNIKQHVQS